MHTRTVMSRSTAVKTGWRPVPLSRGDRKVRGSNPCTARLIPRSRRGGGKSHTRFDSESSGEGCVAARRGSSEVRAGPKGMRAGSTPALATRRNAGATQPKTLSTLTPTPTNAVTPEQVTDPVAQQTEHPPLAGGRRRESVQGHVVTTAFVREGTGDILRPDTGSCERDAGTRSWDWMQPGTTYGAGMALPT